MVKPKTQIVSAASQIDIKPELMTRRKIDLPDGRYLIFFEFSPTPEGAEAQPQKKEGHV